MLPWPNYQVTPKIANSEWGPAKERALQQVWVAIPAALPLGLWDPADAMVAEVLIAGRDAVWGLWLLLLLLSHFSCVHSVRPHRQQPTRLPHPWDSPGKNTGVGCHFLLQCMKVKSESEVTQSCPTPRDAVDCSPSGSSIHGIFQARVLEWVAIPFSGGASGRLL